MAASAKLIVPTDGMVVTTDTELKPGTYLLPKGITIGADDITLDCNGALLMGSNREGIGIACEGKKGVTIKGAKIREYYHGIRCVDCSKLTITGNQITSTAEVPDNTVFLEIMTPPEKAYGGAIMLWKVKKSKIEDNDLIHQMAGVYTFECERIEVRRNDCNFSSGWGIHLWKTCDSVFEENYADYCCRWNKRAEAVGHAQVGHMGGDASGFLCVQGSNRNVFKRNFARMGGDGFFITGCHDNLWEENDGSLSPNISFECTFGSGNVFRNNRADRNNFGFWLGWSWNTIIEGTRMVHNRQAGIACDHGHDNIVRNCEFHSNLHGILLWGMKFDPTGSKHPEHLTSFNWTIEDNSFNRNGNGVTIAADREHGVHAPNPKTGGDPQARPHHHFIRKNTFQDNRIGVELYRTDHNVVENNIMNNNVVAHIMEEDTTDSTIKANLGSVAGYL